MNENLLMRPHWRSLGHDGGVEEARTRGGHVLPTVVRWGRGWGQ